MYGWHTPALVRLIGEQYQYDTLNNDTFNIIYNDYNKIEWSELGVPRGLDG